MKAFALPALALVTVAACGGGEATQAPPGGPKGVTAAPASASAAPSVSVAASASIALPPPPPRPSMLELQKQSVHAFTEAIEAHDAKRLAAGYAPDAVIVEHGLSGRKETSGRDEIERLYARLFTPFPDAKLRPLRVFAKGDVLVEEVVWAGTNTGPTPLGGKPTNKKGGQRAVSLRVFAESGLIQREEVFMDDLTTALQLGLPGAAGLGGKPRAAPEVPAGEPSWMVAVDEPALEAAKTSGWTSFYTKHDRKGLEAVLTDDTVHADNTLAADAKGKRALLAEYDQWLRTFPDLAIDVGEGWGFQDGWVVYEFTAAGTMKGAWGPNRPTNKLVTVHGLAIDQRKDGKLVQSWTYVNGAEALGQLVAPKSPLPKK